MCVGFGGVRTNDRTDKKLNSKYGGLLVNFIVFMATSATGSGGHVSKKKNNSLKLTPLNRAVIDKADNSSVAHEILSILWNPNVHHYFRKSLH